MYNKQLFVISYSQTVTLLVISQYEPRKKVGGQLQYECINFRLQFFHLHL